MKIRKIRGIFSVKLVAWKWRFFHNKMEYNNYWYLKNRKNYKSNSYYNYEMFPSDLTGSLDVFSFNFSLGVLSDE